jgi:hypothetical protein
MPKKRVMGEEDPPGRLGDRERASSGYSAAAVIGLNPPLTVHQIYE